MGEEMKLWIKGDLRQEDYYKLLSLKKRILNSIFSGTSTDSENWSLMNPMYGQSAIVAILVQRIFGGRILKASLAGIPGYEEMGDYYWNRLPYGAEVDLSADQFKNDLRNSLPAGKEISGEPDTGEKFELFYLMWGGY